MTLRFPPARYPAEDYSDSPSPLPPPLHKLPTLVSPRLSLRPVEARDAKQLHGIFSDALTMRFWHQPPLRSHQEIAAHLEDNEREHQRGRLLQWGVTLTGSGQLVGLCHLAKLQPTQRRADIGFVLARAHWGRGYGLEALATLLDHAFGQLRLRRLEAEIDARNLHYLKTLETLGFKLEGYLRQRWLVEGQARDSVLLGLLAHDHRAQASIEAMAR